MRNGKSNHVVGDELVIKVSSRDTDGAFTVFEGRTLPLHGPPLYAHHRHDETWRVISGEFLFEVDGQDIYAGPGATVFAPRGSRHTFQNIGTKPGQLVATVVPGGLDFFFEELESIDPAQAAPILQRHGLELLGPPVAQRNVATAAARAD